MSEKWLDRGKDAEPALLSPKMLQLARAQAEEFKQRAEKAEAELAHYKKLYEDTSFVLNAMTENLVQSEATVERLRAEKKAAG